MGVSHVTIVRLRGQCQPRHLREQSWWEGWQCVGRQESKASSTSVKHSYPLKLLCFHGTVFQLWHLLRLFCLQTWKWISQSLLMYRNLLFFFFFPSNYKVKPSILWLLGEQVSGSWPQYVITSWGQMLYFDATFLMCMWGLGRGSPVFQKPKFCFPIERTWLRGSAYMVAKINRRSQYGLF